jgi:hypothetical protein
VQSSKLLDLPLDFYFILNNYLASFGRQYMKSLPEPIDSLYEISVLTRNPHHKNIYISVDEFIVIVTALYTIGFEVFDEGFYLWENIYEKARQKNHPDKPSREFSFFLFDNIKDCKYYIHNHKGGGTICEVQILETRFLFKGDMNLLDMIPNNFTLKQTISYAEEYWSGMTSDKAVYEYLFQGRCKLKPI